MADVSGAAVTLQMLRRENEQLRKELHKSVPTAYHDDLMQDWMETHVKLAKEVERLRATIQAALDEAAPSFLGVNIPFKEFRELRESVNED